MLKSVRRGRVSASVWGGMSVDVDWEVVPGGEACRGRVFWQPFGQVVPQNVLESDFE